MVTAHVLPFTLVTHVLLVKYQESLLNADTFDGTVGTAHPSFINLPVVQSNTAKCQFVLEDGHTTSHVLVVYPLGLLES
jgi:hypothetical protein